MMVDMIFAGEKASDYFIHVKTHRPLRPALSENMLKIPGRDGMFDQGGSSYDMRGVNVDCIVNRDSLPELRQHIRRVSAWLCKTGRLSFTDEPDKYYIGRIYSEIMLEQLFTHGTWSLTFVTQPFAYGRHTQTAIEGQSGMQLPVTYNATAKTHCRIIIKNTGNANISALRIVQTIKTGGNN